MQDQLSFGELLQRYRARAALSQEELAERSGLGASTISALERGVRRQPYPHTRQLLARALGLSPAEEAAFVALPRGGRLSRQPPEVAVPEPPTNLPARRTALFGRERARAAIVELLRHDQGRLVTLTGVGGCGKTSLALAVATELRAAFPGGAWLVELAPLSDAQLLVPAVAAALGLHETVELPTLDALIHWLRRRPLLLVLDNCEHLIEACAALVEQLLSCCPELRVLATSREPLQLVGERQWRVAPLATPDPNAGLGPAELAAYPAVQLFLARAQAVAPEFAVTDDNAAAVARICARLAGLPLAVELAAARVRVLTAAQLLARLDDAIALLTGGARAAPTRQQTLRATLAWSYALLTPAERRVFRRLGVFAGDCELEAAEAVCAGADLPVAAVLDLLTHLVDKSLLQPEVRAARVRYRLLEPVRQYAQGLLRDEGELAAARARHAAYFLELAEAAAPALRGPEQLTWLERLEAEQDNLRAALQWSREQDDPALGARLAVALAPYWEARGRLREGRRWLELQLEHPAAGGLPAELRAGTLLAAGRLAQWQTDLVAAARRLEAALAVARPRGEEAVVVEALAYLGAVRRQQGELAQSRQLLEECVARARAAADEAGLALALLTLGVTMRELGNLAHSVSLLEESLSRFERLGDLRWIAVARTMLGGSLLHFEETGRTERNLLEGLAGHQAVGDLTFSVFGLLCLAALLTIREQPARAARVLGAMLAMGDRVGSGLSPSTQRAFDMIVAHVRGQLDSSDFERYQVEGSRLTLDQVLAELSSVLIDLDAG